jgi:hypothetical protein
LIDQYERAVEAKDEPAQRATLATLDAVLEGKQVEIEGPEGRRTRLDALVSGEAAQIISDAQLYRSSVVSKAVGDLNLFDAKVEQFRSNPLVMINRDWLDSLRTFMDRESVQTVTLPLGASPIQISINADPEITKARKKAEQLRQTLESNRKRMEDQRKGQFKTDTESPKDSR